MKTDKMTLEKLIIELHKQADAKKAMVHRSYFKRSKNDTFLGVPAATIRQLAKEYASLSFVQIRKLMQSKTHDERSLAHAILCLKFKKGTAEEQEKIYEFYLQNRKYIRDWSGVDDSAPYIVGAHVLDKDKKILYELAESNHIWDRRIAIVATAWLIRHGQLNHTLKLAKLLLNDDEDLMHKATGWMLREVGKRDEALLKKFLDKHHANMPRVMLRYAIERFNPSDRKYYLSLSG